MPKCTSPTLNRAMGSSNVSSARLPPNEKRQRLASRASVASEGEASPLDAGLGAIYSS